MPYGITGVTYNDMTLLMGTTLDDMVAWGWYEIVGDDRNDIGMI